MDGVPELRALVDAGEPLRSLSIPRYLEKVGFRCPSDPTDSINLPSSDAIAALPIWFDSTAGPRSVDVLRVSFGRTATCAEAEVNVLSRFLRRFDGPNCFFGTLTLDLDAKINAQTLADILTSVEHAGCRRININGPLCVTGLNGYTVDLDGDILSVGLWVNCAALAR